VSRAAQCRLAGFIGDSPAVTTTPPRPATPQPPRRSEPAGRTRATGSALPPVELPSTRPQPARPPQPAGDPDRPLEIRYEIDVVDGEKGRRLAALQAQATMEVLEWLHRTRTNPGPDPPAAA